MDYWSYLPFLQFIRDDKETVTIMAEAMRIVPNVCKILHLSRSNGRTTMQPNGDTPDAPNVNDVSQPMPPRSPTTVSSTSSSQPSSPLLPELNSRDIAAADTLVILSRKRSEEANSSSGIMYPLKKRRLMQRDGTPDTDPRDSNQPSTSRSVTVAAGRGREMNNHQRAARGLSFTGVDPTVFTAQDAQFAAEDHLTILRLKLKEDYDTFVDQVGQLASLERQKNTLIQKFVQLCTAASLSSAPTDTPNPEASGTSPPTAGSSHAVTSTTTTSALETVNGSSTDVENDHPYAAASSPPSTSP